MKLETMCHIHFSNDEIKTALLDQVECVANDYIPGSPEYERLVKIIEHARQNYCVIDFNDDGVVLLIDGVAITEQL